MDNLIINDLEYRIKKMNAIELLALRTQMGRLDTFDIAKTAYNTLLEMIEVKIGDKWLPVKEKNRNIYYPSNIEEDIKSIEKLLKYMSEYLMSVFQ